MGDRGRARHWAHAGWLAAALQPGTALLQVEHGYSEPARFLLDQPVSLAGHHPDAEVFLDDMTVSRRHAQIERHPAGYTVRDLDSVNGTYLNGHWVSHAVLTTGDVLLIGRFRLRFITPAQPAPTGAVPAGRHHARRRRLPAATGSHPARHQAE